MIPRPTTRRPSNIDPGHRRAPRPRRFCPSGPDGMPAAAARRAGASAALTAGAASSAHPRSAATDHARGRHRPGTPRPRCGGILAGRALTRCDIRVPRFAAVRPHRRGSGRGDQSGQAPVHPSRDASIHSHLQMDGGWRVGNRPVRVDHRARIILEASQQNGHPGGRRRPRPVGGHRPAQRRRVVRT